LEATTRFVRAAVERRGLRLSIVSQEPAERLPHELRSAVHGFQRVGSALDEDQLEHAVRALARGFGGEVHALVGILEQLQEPLAAVRERLGIPGMGREAARNFRDKSRMKDVLRAHGLPCAGHRLCQTVAAAMEFASECGYPLVVKPPAGAGARNTFRVENEAELRSGLASMPPSAERAVLLEEFITGSEFSFDSVTVEGEHVFHSISRYHPSPLEVMSTPWIQWAVLLPRDISGPEYAPIAAAGPRALHALGMWTGMTHMEWFRREDGSIAISEVAARPPGAQFTSLISYAHDLDFYDAWIGLMTEGRFEPPARRWAVGAAFLRGQGTGRVTRVHGLAEAQRELGELVVEAKLPKVGQAPGGSYEGEGYVILRHGDTEVVERGLSRLVSLLRVELG
jgi:biotin carboxylase